MALEKTISFRKIGMLVTLHVSADEKVKPRISLQTESADGSIFEVVFSNKEAEELKDLFDSYYEEYGWDDEEQEERTD